MTANSEVELTKARQSFALLYEISRAVVSSRYLEEILTLIVGLTAEMIGSNICSLMLLDENKQVRMINPT